MRTAVDDTTVSRGTGRGASHGSRRSPNHAVSGTNSAWMRIERTVAHNSSRRSRGLSSRSREIMMPEYAAPGFFPPDAKRSVTGSSREKALEPFDSASAQAQNNYSEARPQRPARTLMWLGLGLSVAGLGAAVAYAVARAVIGSRKLPDDPTSQRIQQLIDEANALLKTLDDQKHSA